MTDLASFPRVALAHRPTPIERLPNISRLLGGPEVWVKRDDCTGLGMGGNKARQLEFYLGEAVARKRDDCTGLGMGGNKARQLEFYLGEAVARGADTVIITGAVQSNFVRATAAAAAKLGMACEIQLEDRVAGMDETYRRSGNVLLDQLFGARVHHYPEGEDEAGADAALEAIADRIRGEGGKPYVIHLAEGHRPLGALGYVDAAHEIVDQCAELDISFDAVVVPSGSGATHAGLLVGLASRDRGGVAVHGVCVRRDGEAQAGRILRTARATAEELGGEGRVADAAVITHDDWVAPGYGHASGEVLEAIRLAARNEGLLLDPVYSGKAFAGLVGLARRDVFAAGSSVLFIHTGGAPALFGYRGLMASAGLLD